MTSKTSTLPSNLLETVCIAFLSEIFTLVQVKAVWRIVLLPMIAAFIFFFYKYPTAPLATHPQKYLSRNDKLVDIQPSHHGQHGYMLSLAFRDQGTGYFVNLMCLRCFASAIGGVRVVEPFVLGSHIELNLSVSNRTKELRFSDLFDSRATESFAMRKNTVTWCPLKNF